MKTFKVNARKYQGGFVSWIGAIGGLVSGLSGASAASDAADAQAKSAAEANATQRYMYDTTRADNAPFLNNGVAGNNKLAYLLGLNPAGNSSGSASYTREQLRNQLMPKYTAQGAPKPAMGGDTSGLMAQILASQTQGAPTGLSGSQFSPTWQYAGQDSGLAPGTLAGFGGNGSQLDEAGLNAEIERMMAEQQANQQSQQQQATNDPAFGSLLRRFTMADRDADPVYQSGLQFGLDQGTTALNRMAAARGGYNSGAQLKALTRFGNDYGSTKAGEARNRFVSDQDSTYNRLAGISGTGQTASSMIGSAGQNYGNQVSQNQLGVGNARASSYIAGANAFGGGLAGGYNALMQGQQMDAYRQRTNSMSGLNRLMTGSSTSGGYDHGYFDSGYGAGSDYSGFDSTWG